MKKNIKISSRKLTILIVAIILLIIIGIIITMARYSSIGTTTATAQLAFTVVEEGYQSGNVMFENLYPREEKFLYEFTITNTDGEHVAETSLDYTMDFKITTNLPLEIEVYKNDKLLTSEEDIVNEIVLDSSRQNYIRHIKIKNGTFIFNELKEDKYKLLVTFPIEYSENEEYEGVVDNVSILLEATQKID